VSELSLNDIDESEIQIEGQISEKIQAVFGLKIALCLVASNWQFKEQAMKFIFRTMENYLTNVEIT